MSLFCKHKWREAGLNSKLILSSGADRMIMAFYCEKCNKIIVKGNCYGHRRSRKLLKLRVKAWINENEEKDDKGNKR